MGDAFASGNWHVKDGKEDEFIDRWHEFLGWTQETHPALIAASLIRDLSDPGHFLSYAEWSDEDARRSWKETEGFAERFGACRALCDDFYGSDYVRAVAI